MAYKQLTDEQRYKIEALKREGFTQLSIAQSIAKSPSTISRELRRNGDDNGYRGALAVKRTDKRRREAKKSEKIDLAMCSMIKNLLEDYLSPEQISGRLMLEKEIAISHETIYRFVKPALLKECNQSNWYCTLIMEDP
jgi:transposase, IS30 family